MTRYSNPTVLQEPRHANNLNTQEENQSTLKDITPNNNNIEPTRINSNKHNQQWVAVRRKDKYPSVRKIQEQEKQSSNRCAVLEEEVKTIHKDLSTLHGEEETCQKESLKEESKPIECDVEKMSVNNVEEIAKKYAKDDDFSISEK